MKHSNFILLLFCITIGTLLTNAQNKKIALTTFWVQKHIGFEELGGGAQLSASISSLSEDPNFHLQPVLDNFYKTFMTE